MKYLALVPGLFAASIAVAEQPVLTVLTYDSFVSDWGPGPAVKKAFEAKCGCEVRFQSWLLPNRRHFDAAPLD